MTKQDERQFSMFCANATDSQLFNIWAKVARFMIT